jgi:hypothetical protein
MKQDFEAVVLDESKYSTWNELAASAPAGSIYSNTDYLNALCEATGGRFRVLGIYRGGQLTGGIALYEEESRFGTVLSNRLLLYYNGILIAPAKSSYPSERTARELAALTLLQAKLAQAGYAHTVVHNRAPIMDVRPFVSCGWRAYPSYSYVMTFPDLKAAWARIEQNLRRLIGRCESGGVVLAEDDDFESFFRLHLETHKRKGAPLYLSERRFARYFERLHGLGLSKLFHARTPQGQSVATQLVLMNKHATTHTVCAAADKAFLSQGVSPFLRWKVCEHLAQSGFTANDLTDASLNDVTHFKSQLGGELVMNLVLTRPDKSTYRLHRGLRQTKSGFASLVKKLLSKT